ncbi:MAG: PcfJ domain-containing protein [Lachnospiraceae bacterium]|nr:PcfJ domain-containing protein [Lachnospiraceae bacterium]
MSENEINLFSGIRATGKLLPFDAKISEIPHINRQWWSKNPLDRNTAVKFRIGKEEYLYFLPKTNEIRISHDSYLSDDELSQLFGTKVNRSYSAGEEADEAVRSFMYATVIGEAFVYRRFELTVDCKKIHEQYVCRALPVKETCRYVFCRDRVILEERDGSQTIVTADRVREGDPYDTMYDADEELKRKLYKRFLLDVRLAHKEEIIRALSHVKKKQAYMGYCPFTEIYKKAIEKNGITGKVPKRILRELSIRKHRPGTAVRIEKDLVVVVGERDSETLTCHEQTRAYFDTNRAYYFRQNAVTQQWYEEEPKLQERTWQNNVRYRFLDKDILDHTCMERFAPSSVAHQFPNGQKINLGSLLAQVGFLSAEQAAKIQSPVYEVILQNIYEGKLNDPEKPLSKLLGITGAQIKYLKDIHMPNDLDQFAKCMNDEDFKAFFPDVRKRIFAVSFYLEGIQTYYTYRGNVSKQDIFEAAPTLCSLERTEGEKRELLAYEYHDYLVMHRRYRSYIENMRADDPLREEITAFGTFQVNMKPSKIRDCNSKISYVLDIMGCSENITVHTAAIEKRKKEEAKDREYTNGFYSILMPKDAKDIVREGRILCHCVGRAGYIEAMAAGFCTILFLRDDRNLDTPLITIEERDGRIRQCYGRLDSYNKNAKIRDFIMEYALLKDLEIDAVIYKE